MVENYDLIIFDCDGTLVDSEYLANTVSSGLLIEFGLNDYTPEKCVKEFAGMTWTNIKAMLEEKHGVALPEDLIDRYVTRVNQAIEKELKPVDDVLDVVARCQAQGKVCVASNGQRANVLKSINVTGLDRYFQEDNIFTRIQVPHGKPAPDLFLFAAEKMGAHPSRCLVIEDTPTGTLGGIAAGMDVFGFTGVSHDPKIQEETLKKAGAMAVFDRLIHIVERLGY